MRRGKIFLLMRICRLELVPDVLVEIEWHLVVLNRVRAEHVMSNTKTELGKLLESESASCSRELLLISSNIIRGYYLLLKTNL